MAKPPIPLEDLFVVRTLSVTDSTDKVRVEIGVPKYVSENEAVCPSRYTYRDKVFGDDIHGLDAFQALHLALRHLPSKLRHDDRLPLGRMYWLEAGDDMGFPDTNWPKYPGDEA